MWLCEARGLRLLFDPLIDGPHHGQVFDVRPRRRIRVDGLRPDFILVSHRHGDHFDVPSLKALADADRDAVLITPDPLVAWAASRVGFRTVRQLPAGQHVHLDGVDLVTTPSVAPMEWGAIVATPEASVWNQVDTVLRDGHEVRRVMREAFAAIDAERGAVREAVDLTLARWAPLAEIAAPMCEDIGFPMNTYGRILELLRALPTRALVPSAAGQEQVGPYGWMRDHGYPLTEARFLRDLASLRPDVRGLPSQLGARYAIERGPGDVASVSVTEGAGASMFEDVVPRPGFRFEPFSIPPLVDPQVGRATETAMRERIAVWVEHELAPALALAYPSMGVCGTLALVLEVVFPSATDIWTIRIDGTDARLTPSLDDDWDARDQIAGSCLFEILEGRMHWGDALLGGMLRACSRAYQVSERGLAPARLGKTFLYYALPYDEAVSRAVRSQVEALVD